MQTRCPLRLFLVRARGDASRQTRLLRRTARASPGTGRTCRHRLCQLAVSRLNAPQASACRQPATRRALARQNADLADVGLAERVVEELGADAYAPPGLRVLSLDHIPARVHAIQEMNPLGMMRAATTHAGCTPRTPSHDGLMLSRPSSSCFNVAKTANFDRSKKKRNVLNRPISFRPAPALSPPGCPQTIKPTFSQNPSGPYFGQGGGHACHDQCYGLPCPGVGS